MSRTSRGTLDTDAVWLQDAIAAPFLAAGFTPSLNASDAEGSELADVIDELVRPSELIGRPGGAGTLGESVPAIDYWTGGRNRNSVETRPLRGWHC